MFEVGEKVYFIDFPTLRGVVKDIIPANDEYDESISVDIWIPEDEPDFAFTGCIENFWCGAESLARANNRMERDEANWRSWL